MKNDPELLRRANAIASIDLRRCGNLADEITDIADGYERITTIKKKPSVARSAEEAKELLRR